MSHGEGPPGPNAGDAVLDIGGDVGAVILYADAVYAEAEVEISPIGCDATRTHTAIHERLRRRAEVVFAGLFPRPSRRPSTGSGRMMRGSPTGSRHRRRGGVVDWRRAT